MHFIDMLIMLLFTSSSDEHSHSSTDESGETHSILSSQTGHSHSIILGKTTTEVSVAAYILEFGLTAHSVIIGSQL